MNFLAEERWNCRERKRSAFSFCCCCCYIVGSTFIFSLSLISSPQHLSSLLPSSSYVASNFSLYLSFWASFLLCLFSSFSCFLCKEKQLLSWIPLLTSKDSLSLSLSNNHFLSIVRESIKTFVLWFLEFYGGPIVT